MHRYWGWLLAPFLTTAAYAETVATFGVTSNYVWRAETRTDDAPAVFGALDWSSDRLHFGARTFNIEERRAAGEPNSREYQVDLYGGYRFPVMRAGMEVGAISYILPQGEAIDLNTGLQIPGSENGRDFTEVYVAVGYRGAAVTHYETDDYFGTGKDASYTAVDYQFDVRETAQVGLHWGLKRSGAIPDHARKVSDFGLSLSRHPLRLDLTSLDDNEDGLQSDNARIAISWRHLMPL